MWLYVRKTGNMYHKVDKVLTFLANGYSGRGQYQNNPDAQCIKDRVVAVDRELQP
jgi:hypothetical protein